MTWKHEQKIDADAKIERLRLEDFVVNVGLKYSSDRLYPTRDRNALIGLM